MFPSSPYVIPSVRYLVGLDTDLIHSSINMPPPRIPSSTLVATRTQVPIALDGAVVHLETPTLLPAAIVEAVVVGVEAEAEVEVEVGLETLAGEVGV